MNEHEFIQQLLDPKTQNIAFKQLVALYHKPLYYHIRTIVIDHDDAHDVAQNTFIKIFQNLKNFKQESKLYTWMYRIATNESLSYLSQKAKKNGRSSLEHQAYVVSNLEADVYFEGDAIQLKLQNAIQLLPTKQQLVFKMRYFNELKYEEMSEILGTSVGALKASYHHAVKKIEEYLAKN